MANDIKYILGHMTQATVVLHLIWMCTGALKKKKLQNPLTILSTPAVCGNLNSAKHTER
jgi:hypothetical protein